MFIYVTDKKSKDKLVELGYELLKGNDKIAIWVFKNKEGQKFDSLNISYVISDVLTF